MPLDQVIGVDPVIAEARERWNRCDEAEDVQRKSILAAKKFRSGDQWPPAIRLAREGTTAIQGQAAQPPRPCLTVDRLSPAVRQISNQIKSANFAIDVMPNGFGADDETAQIFKGYLRRVQMNARDDAPVEWAADQAIEGGLGVFRIRTEYVDEFGQSPASMESFDQELRLERIANNLSVYWDPSATTPTKSDGMFAFVTEDLSRDVFKVKWPDADLDGLDDFASTGDPICSKGWVTNDAIRIAEYWRITYSNRELVLLADGSIVNGSDIPKDADVKARRTVRQPKVQGFKITATEVLEKWDWVGSRIPLIPILGEELNVDGQQVLRGVIQEGMDAQQMVNYTYSGAMEIFALGSKSPYIVAEEQVADYAGIWQTANIFNYSYLPYKIVPGANAPVRDQSEAPIQAAVALMVKSEDAIKATTNLYDLSLGDSNQASHRSGRFAEAVQAKADLGSSNYPNNVIRALIYAGELMVEIIPKITRPGQIVQIMGMDDIPEQVMIGQAFVPHPETKQPMPMPGVPPGQPPPPGPPQGQPSMPPGMMPPNQSQQQMQQFQQGLAQFYNLSKGRYAVTVDIGKSSTTKREEGAAALGELIPHLPPEMAAVATPDYVEQLSFNGAHKIAEKLKKTLPPQLQDQDDSGQDPQVPALQQQVQQLQMALKEQQGAEMAKQQAEMQKAQLKAQTDLQTTQLEIQSRERIAWIQASAQLAAVGQKVDAENARSYVDALEQRGAKQLDAHLEKVDAVREQLQAAHDRQHEAIQNTQQQQHEKELAQLEHQHALEQGQQAAALAPVPQADGDGGE